MDPEPLVDEQIAEGQEFVNRLAYDHYDFDAAFWGKKDDESRWYFYIASNLADDKGSLAAYDGVSRAMRSLDLPLLTSFDLKLIGLNDPISKEMLTLQQRSPAIIAKRIRPWRISNVPLAEIYLYPPPNPEKVWLRLAYTVTYYRHGDTDRWRARVKRGQLYRGVAAKGAVASATARWGGETEADENFEIVSVLVELDPQLDEASLNQPQIQGMLIEQARRMADERFLTRHPGAVIEQGESVDSAHVQPAAV